MTELKGGGGQFGLGGGMHSTDCRSSYRLRLSDSTYYSIPVATVTIVAAAFINIE